MLLALVLVVFVRIRNTNPKTKEPGICLTFDDRSRGDWYKLRDLFKDNHVRATFFVSEAHKLLADEIKMLKDLEADGYEIGSHSKNHIFPQDFLKSGTEEDYIRKEVLPSKDFLEKAGFSVTSFAYPGGEGTKGLDKKLLKIFPIIRKTGYTSGNRTIESYNSFYARAGAFVKSMRAAGLDRSYENTDEDIIRGLERAKDKKEILCFYGHQIGREDPQSVDYERLEMIVKEATRLGLKFYRYSDLARLK